MNDTPTRREPTLAALREATALSPGEAVCLPLAAFSDPDVYELECEQIFRRDWIAVCAAAALPDPGDYLALEIAGEPVVVLRGRDGELRALSNVCRHRGTPLLEGFGRADKLVCPYHAWAYDDQGAFLGAPHTGNIEIDAKAHCLPHFRLEEWMGAVFVNLDPEAEPLAERMEGAERFFARYGLEHFSEALPLRAPQRWKANWKLAYMNGIESYHLFRVHPQTLEPYSPTRGACYVEGSAPWSVTAGALVRDNEPQPWDPPRMTDVERGNYLLLSLPPSMVGVLTRGSWGWISILPTAPDECLVHGGSLSLPMDEAMRAASTAATDAFLAEDQVICERNQRAMRARATRGGQLVELERVVVDFQQYLGWRLFDAAPDPRFSAPEAGRYEPASG